MISGPKKSQNFHEVIEVRNDSPPPSDRSVGLVVALVLAFIAFQLRTTFACYIALPIAVLLAIAALVRPDRLRWLAVGWMQLGAVLARVMNPLVMLVLYSILILPLGLVLRFLMDPLQLKRKKSSGSHWIETSSGNSDMRNQF